MQYANDFNPLGSNSVKHCVTLDGQATDFGQELWTLNTY